VKEEGKGVVRREKKEMKGMEGRKGRGRDRSSCAPYLLQPWLR